MQENIRFELPLFRLVSRKYLRLTAILFKFENP